MEWAIQRLFKNAGYSCQRAAGSHGLADLIAYRTPEDALDLTRPLTLEEVDEVLSGWLEVQDPKLILPEFLYGRRKYLARGGEQFIHMTPATVWFLQAKSKKGK